MFRTALRRQGVVALVVLAATALLAPAAFAGGKPATSTKYYSAAGPTAAVPLDGTHTADIVLTNCGCGTTSSTQPFGSVEVRVPSAAGLQVAGATATWSGAGSGVDPWSVGPGTPVADYTVFRLTNSGTGTSAAVARTQTLTLSIPVPTSATPGSYDLTTQVKQSNDFGGAGNDFVNNGSEPVLKLGQVATHLAWVTQPTSIQSTSTPSTSDSILSMCKAPQVEALDAANARVTSFTGTVTLTPSSGTFTGLTAPATAGLATFGTCSSGVRSSSLGYGYTMVAGSTGLTKTVDSSAFDVLQYLANCGATCTTTTLTGDGTTASASAKDGSDVAPQRFTFSVNGDETWVGPDKQLLDCNPDIGAPSDNKLRDVVTVDLAEHSKHVSLQWSKKAVQAATNNGASQWGVCMLAANSFPGSKTVTGYFGTGHDGYVGLLQACGTAGLSGTDPCIAKLNKTAGGMQQADVSLPNVAGDPKFF